MVIINYDAAYIDQMPDNFTGKTFSVKYFDNYGKIFWKNKRIHRYYGPSQIWHDGHKKWRINNLVFGQNWDKFNYKYSQKQFIKDLNKRWLS